ncbi:hypothetical protein [Microbulbifer sp. JMSA003]|uniref:hypothetical protein n=1 Tax=Microbulbifer sp. JMSA003 TaxID=3243369 RepID=UPI004039AE51
MNGMKPEYGTTYYQVVYADPKLTMPGITPKVFVGVNLFGTEKEDTYYFQDTVSVLIFGLIGEAEDTTDCKVSSFTQDELGVTIVTLEQASEIMSAAVTKTKELGYPKLKKASGKWQTP